MGATGTGTAPLPDVNLGPLTTPFTAPPGCAYYAYTKILQSLIGFSTATQSSLLIPTTVYTVRTSTAYRLNGGIWSPPGLSTILPASGCYPDRQVFPQEYTAAVSVEHVYFAPASCPRSWTSSVVDSTAVDSKTTYTTAMCCAPSLTPTSTVIPLNVGSGNTVILIGEHIYYCVTTLTATATALSDTQTVVFNDPPTPTVFKAPGLFVRFTSDELKSIAALNGSGSGQVYVIDPAIPNNNSTPTLSGGAIAGMIIGITFAAVFSGAYVVWSRRRMAAKAGNQPSKRVVSMAPPDPKVLMAQIDPTTIAAPVDPRMAAARGTDEITRI